MAGTFHTIDTEATEDLSHGMHSAGVLVGTVVFASMVMRYIHTGQSSCEFKTTGIFASVVMMTRAVGLPQHFRRWSASEVFSSRVWEIRVYPQQVEDQAVELFELFGRAIRAHN